MTAAPVTPRQAEVLDAVMAYWAAEGMSPSVRDLCEVLEISSPNGVICHLKPLLLAGLIEWESESKAAGRAGQAAAKRKKGGSPVRTRGLWPAGWRAEFRRLADELRERGDAR
jgi:SOS-response transcriptional repressor LexA